MRSESMETTGFQASIAKFRCVLFRNAAIDALDIGTERVEGLGIHVSAGGNQYAAAIVLDRAGERLEFTGDELGFLILEHLDGFRRNRGVKRSHHHHSLLEAPTRMTVAGPGAVQHLL